MAHVISVDGTSIAYDREGSGPAVILVGGGLDDGSENAPLVPELARWFSVFNYARRGRDGSGDTAPYSLQREIEDLDALIAAAGGSAHLYGVSSGGALALEAAAAGLAVERLAVYEVPYNMAPDWPARWRAYTAEVRVHIDAGRRDKALEAFLRVTGASGPEIAGAKTSPFWSVGEALAHTLAYDAACMGDGQPPRARFARIGQPTLVATGVSAQEPGAPEWVMALDAAANAIVDLVANAERRVFEGQGHVADPGMIAPLLARFFQPAPAPSGG